MLVATPGQTATYALATGPSAKKATTLPSANTTNNNITGATKVLNSVGTASITANSSNSNNNNKNLNNSNSSSGHNNTFTFNTLKNVFISNSNIRENIPTTITTTPMSATAAAAAAATTKIDNSLSEAIPVNSSNNSKSKTATSLMKSLTVRINRGTETLKATVHKALITATAVSSIVERKTINDEAIATKKATATTTTAAKTTTTTSTATTNASTIASLKTSSCINTSASTSTSSSNAAAAASAAAAAAVALLATPHKYPSATFLKLYAVSPTIIHRLPSEREQTSSTDSLNKEMCHFKPIRTAPTTPWKSGSKSRGISLRFPKANIATNPEFNKKPNCDVINRKEDKNRDMNHDRNLYENLKPKSSSSTLLLTRLLATPSHQSAFVCLMAQMENLTKMHTNLDNNGLQSNAKNVSDLRKISEFRRPKDVPSKLTKIQKKRSNSILTNTNVTNEMLINKLKHKSRTPEIFHERPNTRASSRRQGGGANSIVTNMTTNANTNAAIAAATAALNNAGIKTRTTVKITPSASRAAAKDANATTTTATLSIIEKQKQQKPKMKMIDLVKLTTQNSRLQSKPAAAATAAAAGKTAKQIKSGTVSPANSQTSSKRRKITRKRKSNDNPEPVTAVKIKLLSTTTTTTTTATKTTTSNPKGIKSNAFKNNTSVAKLSKDRITKNLKANSDVILKKLKEKETGRRTVFGKNNPIQKKSVTSQRPSPPLTRSRLKEMQAANEAKRT